MAYIDVFEETITKVGGCGVYQWIICVIMHVSKIVLTFSTITMAFVGHSPEFMCRSMQIEREKINNMDFEDLTVEGLCEVDESVRCNSYLFHTKIFTAVSEWDLVCSQKWIVTLITSLQMVGVLLGCPLSSYMADYLGPKLTFISGFTTVVVFNFVSIYSTYVELYVVMRMIIGLGIGLSVPVQFALMIQYLPAKSLPVLSTLPSISIAACLFAPVAWWLHEWKMVHLFIAIAGLPTLLLLWIVPDNFRWQMMKYKQSRVTATFRMIARINRKERIDVNNLLTEACSELEVPKSESRFVDLFKTKLSFGLTAGLFFAWFAVGYTYFGVIFGVGVLQGNYFLNLLLVTVIDAPLVAFTGPLVNWLGKKKYGVCMMVVSGVCGVAAGVLQYTHFSEFRLVTAFALVCKMTGTSVWVVLMMHAMEIYPSHIRTLAYGLHYSGSLLGGAVSSPIILLSDNLPGLFYLVSGIMMLISAICFPFLRKWQYLTLEEPVLEKDETADSDLTAAQRMNRAKHWSISSMEIP